MDNFMRNMKVVHICWTCNKEHYLGEWNPHEYWIKCDCGGFVVSPSGKVQCSIAPIVPVFKIDDGESHWIAAADEEQAKAAYEENYGETLEQDATIERVEAQELNRPTIMHDELGHEVTLMHIIRETDHFPAILASSVW